MSTRDVMQTSGNVAAVVLLGLRIKDEVRKRRMYRLVCSRRETAEALYRDVEQLSEQIGLRCHAELDALRQKSTAKDLADGVCRSNDVELSSYIASFNAVATRAAAYDVYATGIELSETIQTRRGLSYGLPPFVLTVGDERVPGFTEVVRHDFPLEWDALCQAALAVQQEILSSPTT